MLRRNNIVLACVLGALLQGCSSFSSKERSIEAPLDSEMRRQKRLGSLFGDEALVFGVGNALSRSKAVTPVGMRVNPLLWQATLETLNFMPLLSADAIGGVILTDWFISPKKPSQRTKVTARITGVELKAASLQVRLYRQTLSHGQWINAVDADEDASNELEVLILRRARTLNIQQPPA